VLGTDTHTFALPSGKRFGRRLRGVLRLVGALVSESLSGSVVSQVWSGERRATAMGGGAGRASAVRGASMTSPSLAQRSVGFAAVAMQRCRAALTRVDTSIDVASHDAACMDHVTNELRAASTATLVVVAPLLRGVLTLLGVADGEQRTDGDGDGDGGGDVITVRDRFVAAAPEVWQRMLRFVPFSVDADTATAVARCVGPRQVPQLAASQSFAASVLLEWLTLALLDVAAVSDGVDVGVAPVLLLEELEVASQ
jgi:hypothetical protein